MRKPITQAELISTVYDLVKQGHSGEVTVTKGDPDWSGKPTAELRVTTLGNTTISVVSTDSYTLYLITEDNNPIVRELKIFK